MRRFLACAACLVVPWLSCAADGVVQGPRGLYLDAARAGDSTVVAVGERGAIQRSTDAGRTWLAVASPTSATLTGLTFADAQTGWTVGHEGVVLTTRDGGSTWQTQAPEINRDTIFLGVAAQSSSHVLAHGAFGTAWLTADGGRTWQSVPVLSGDMHLNRVLPLPEGWALAGESGTLFQTNATLGAPRFIVPDVSASLHDLVRIDAQTLLATGLEGTVLRSENNGRDWQPVSLPTQGLIAAAAVVAPGTVLLAGAGDSFYVSQDSGRSFAAAPHPTGKAVSRLVALEAGWYLVVGEQGLTRVPLSFP